MKSKKWYLSKTLWINSLSAGVAVLTALQGQAKPCVTGWKRTAMYLAVRLHSWWNYGRNTPSGGFAVDSAPHPPTRPSDGGYREDWA